MLNSIRITVSLSQNIIVNFLTVWKLRNWTNLNVKVCMYIAYIRWLKIIWKVFRLFLGKYIAKIYYFFFSKTLEKNRRIVKRKIKYLIHGYIIIVFLSFSRYNLYCSFKVSTTRKACSCSAIVKDRNHFLIFSLNKHFYVHTYISLILYHKQRRIRKIFPI